MLSPNKVHQQRYRTENAYGALRLVGITNQEIARLESLHFEGSLQSTEVQQRATALRKQARKLLEIAGLEPDKYIHKELIGPVNSLPSESLTGVLSVLGTTERMLEELDFAAPMELRTLEAWEKLPEEYRAGDTTEASAR